MAYTFAGTYGPAPITDLFGHPLTGLTVAVYATGTQNLVNLYTDRTMVTPATNPTTTDDIGNLTFFCAPGQVDIAGNNATITVVIPPDPADLATLDGSAFTGPVSLAADPTTNLGAATKEYVDSHGGGGGGSVASVFGRTGAVVPLGADYSGFYLQKADNLSDIESASTARTNLGLASAATQASSAFDAAGTAASAQAAAEAASVPLTQVGSGADVLPASGLLALQKTVNVEYVARAVTAQDSRRRGGSVLPNILDGMTKVATVTNITNSGTTVTVTAPVPVAVGQLVTIAGAAGITDVNGVYTVATVTATGFTFVATAGTPSGTYTANSATASVTTPVIDVILGDSIPYGEGAGSGGVGGVGITDHQTVLATMENRAAGLPDPGRGWRRCQSLFFSADTWTSLAVGSEVSNSGPSAIYNTSWAITSSSQVIGDTQVFRRAVVFIKRRTNGDGVQVSFNGGSSFTSTLDANGSGYFMVDSGDLGSIASRTLQVAWESHVTGSGGGGLEVAGALLFQTGGTTGTYPFNIAAGGSSLAQWTGVTDWDTYILPLLQPRRLIICAGVNDLALGATASAGSNTGTSVTLTVAGIYSSGDTVVVTGATGTWASINGTWTATAGSNGSVTFTVSSAPTSSMAGTVNVAQNMTMVIRNLTNIVTRAQSASPLTEVVIAAEYHPGNTSPGYNTGITGANWFSQFVEPYNLVAETYGCTFVDLFARFGDVSVRSGDAGDPYGLTQGTLGVTGDGTHFGDASRSVSGRDAQRALAETYWEKLSYAHVGLSKPAPGWTLDTATWGDPTGTIFVVVGNATRYLATGTKLRWTESGVVKYGVVASVAFTAGGSGVTMISTSDYTMGATPDPGSTWYSYEEPPDFPSAFTWSNIAFTGWSGTPTSFATFSVTGRRVSVMAFISGTSNATTVTCTAPVVSAANGEAFGACAGVDNGTSAVANAGIATSSSTINVNKGASILSGTWTATGTKVVTFQLQYGI